MRRPSMVAELLDIYDLPKEKQKQLLDSCSSEKSLAVLVHTQFKRCTKEYPGKVEQMMSCLEDTVLDKHVYRNKVCLCLCQHDGNVENAMTEYKKRWEEEKHSDYVIASVTGNSSNTIRERRKFELDEKRLKELLGDYFSDAEYVESKRNELIFSVKNIQDKRGFRVANMFESIAVTENCFPLKKADVILKINGEDAVTLSSDKFNKLKALDGIDTITVRRMDIEDSTVDAELDIYDKEKKDLVKMLSTMRDTMGNASRSMIIDLLLENNMSVDFALNEYFGKCFHLESTLGNIIGKAWYGQNLELDYLEKNPDVNFTTMYEATLQAGPMGITVENVLERTIVIKVKPQGNAEHAGVCTDSWIVAINGKSTTMMQHRETLHELEIASRPMTIRFIVLSNVGTQLLRAQFTTLNPPRRFALGEGCVGLSTFNNVQKAIETCFLGFPKSFEQSIFEFPINCLDWHINSGLLVRTRFGIAQVFKDAFRADTTIHTKLLLQQHVHAYVQKCSTSIIWYPGFKKRLDNTMHICCTDDCKTSCKQNGFFRHFLGAISKQLKRQTSNTNFDFITYRLVVYILEAMVQVEQGEIWDMVIKIFGGIAHLIPIGMTHELFVPAISRLSFSEIPIARTASIAIALTMCDSVTGDTKLQIRGMIDRLSFDDCVLVRKALSLHLNYVVRFLDEISLVWFLRLLKKLFNDVDEIRQIVVSSCSKIAFAYRRLVYNVDWYTSEEERSKELRKFHCLLMNMLSDWCSGSVHIRHELSTYCPGLCVAVGPELVDLVVEFYVTLLKDESPSIRTRALAHLCAVGRALLIIDCQELYLEQNFEMVDHLEQLAISNQTDKNKYNAEESNAVKKIANVLLPVVTDQLSKVKTDVDYEETACRELASLLSLLGPNHMHEFQSTCLGLLNDSKLKVRASACKELSSCASIFPIDVMETLCETHVAHLASDKAWRNRKIAVLAIGHICESIALICELESEAADIAARHKIIEDILVPIVFAGALDNVHNVRMESCRSLHKIHVQLGLTWFQEALVPFFLERLSINCRNRIMVLYAIEQLSVGLCADAIFNIFDVLDITQHSEDRAPSVRCAFFRSLLCLLNRLHELQGNVKGYAFSSIHVAQKHGTGTSETDSEVVLVAKQIVDRYLH